MPLYSPPPVFPADLQGEMLDFTRSSEVSTISRFFVSSSFVLNSGVVYGAIARVRTAGTFTKVRIAVGSTLSVVTDLRIGIYDATGATKLGETGNLSASATLNTLMDNQALTSSVSLTQGQVVFLAVGFIGTSISIACRPLIIVGPILTSVTPTITRGTSGWTTGPLPATLSGTSVNAPWIELIP